MGKILIVSDVQSYLLVSIQEKLEESNLEVIQEKLNPDKLSKIKDEIDLVLLFADEEILKNHQGIIYVKDRSIEDDLPVFIIGDSVELEILEKDIPANLIIKEFIRPVNVKEVSEAIIQYIANFGKQNKKKILVVDDSGAMLRNVKGWLEDKYQVVLANSGAMAMKYLSRNKPDLVLLDYEMPIVDGSQVLGMIRSENEFADIPVIFLTSKRDKETVMKVMDLKPDGYILKNTEPAQIVQFINDFFEKNKAKI